MLIFIAVILDFILHMDEYLPTIMQDYGALLYVMMFVIIFCETGLVVMPFLPGDSIIFACGALAVYGGLNIFILLITLIAAAILGDTTNYLIGKKIGVALIKKGDGRFIKKKHIEKTQEFYNKYGGKAIFLGRFTPIIRTFVPFVAGIGHMDYKKFGIYNITGGVTWVTLFLMGGALIGNIPLIKENFSAVVVAIILLSLIPVAYEVLKGLKEKKAESK